jgi:hypothetical protein
MPILPGASSTPDAPRTPSFSSFLTRAPFGEGKPRLVVPVDVGAEEVLQILFDKAEAIANTVGLEELVAIIFTYRGGFDDM